MIENILKQNDFDVNVCIRILEEGKNNSWSNIVAPQQKVLNLDDVESVKKEKSTKSKKNKNTQGKNNQQQTKQSQTNQQGQTNQQQTNQQSQNNQQQQSQNNQQQSHTNQQSQTNQQGHTNQNNQQGQTIQKQKQTQTTNNRTQTQNHPPPEEMNLRDLEGFENSLLEQQGLLTKQTKFVNSLMDEYQTLKGSQTSRIEILKTERKKLEDKRNKLQDDYNEICQRLRDLGETIENTEKDLVNKLSTIRKKSDQTKLQST